MTLEVTPKIAEKVSVAQTIGTLSLSLRSIADNQAELERAIASGDVNIPENISPEEEEKLLREAMGRPNDGATTFQTGGDVSRFQRSTIPKKKTAPAPQTVVTVAAPAPGNGTVTSSPPPVPKGPVVRVTRGKATTEVEVGK